MIKKNETNGAKSGTKCGIICEYNPFHNGHKYHLEQARRLTGADIICVMSGDFTQRCSPAIFDKRARTLAALRNGADAVLELPVLYSTAVGEHFAYGAVKILSQIKGLEYLSFGIETENTRLLEEIAEFLAFESFEFKALLREFLRGGLSYPAAVAKTAAQLFGDSESGRREVLAVLSGANNVLAIEYLKAIRRQKSDIKPIYVRRTDGGYNSRDLTPPFAAAGAIRGLIERGEDYSAFVPFDFGKSAVNFGVFDAFLRYSLLQSEMSDGNFDPAIAIRLKKAATDHGSFEEIARATKTKNFTYSGLVRQAFSSLLGIDSQLFAKNDDFLFNVLGVKQDFKCNLGDLGQNAVIRQGDISCEGDFALDLLALDRRASDLYATITGSPATRFYSKLVVEK